jgi:ATP-binding cassette subfamily A (ABC1) protein 3
MVLKAIPVKYRANMLTKILHNLNLSEYRNKNAGTLSGGNKRKLSVAMSLIGNPPVILLDEPSAGMDPEARRFMWGVVAKVSQEQKQSGVVISTHSMEEAEALSTKMGIQVKGGVFKCFGSSQHIKNKYATGYEIEAKFKVLSDDELTKAKNMLMITKEDKRIDLNSFIEKLKKHEVDQFLIDEINENGFGSDLINQQNQF